jgi:thiamine biosynthesis protein ThiS
LRITVKTSEPLRRFLPGDGNGKTAQLELAEGCTAAQVLAQLGLPEDQSLLVILNESALPKAQRAETILKDGDVLTFLPPLKGG